MFKISNNIYESQTLIVKMVILILRVSTFITAMLLPYSAIPIICTGLGITEFIDFIYYLYCFNTK